MTLMAASTKLFAMNQAVISMTPIAAAAVTPVTT
jgi:hypothetical protein